MKKNSRSYFLAAVGGVVVMGTALTFAITGRAGDPFSGSNRALTPDRVLATDVPKLKKIVSTRGGFTPVKDDAPTARGAGSRAPAAAALTPSEEFFACMSTLRTQVASCHDSPTQPGVHYWPVSWIYENKTHILYAFECYYLGEGQPGPPGTANSWGCTREKTNALPGGNNPPEGPPENQCGSIIHVDDRVVGETIDIAGSDQSLVYFTDRDQGFRKGNLISIKWFLQEVPAAVADLKIRIEYAGRLFEQTFTPQLGFVFDFVWDGKNASNQVVQSGTVAKVTVTERLSNGETIETPLTYMLGGWRAASIGLGGWTISGHHFYAVEQKRIFYGYGGSRKVEPRVFGTNQISIPSEDGSQVYIFNQSGEHLSTRHALQGEVIRTFAYDSARRLSSISDPFGNVTRIERNSSGLPTAIVAPFGQRTIITPNTSGRILEVQDPTAAKHVMTYVANLLKTFKHPGGQATTFSYDGNGLLISDVNSSGKSQTITSTDDQIELTSGGGKKVRYFISVDSDGALSRTKQIGNRVENYRITKNAINGLTFDGTGRSITRGEDDRFGAQLLAPVETQLSMGGLSQVESWGNDVTRSSAQNIFSTTNYREVAAIDTRSWVKQYSATNMTWTYQTPLLRQSFVTVDSSARPVSVQHASFLPVTLSYDTRGRVSQISNSTRQTTFTYKPEGFLASVTNPLGQVRAFDYDLNGRVRVRTDPLGNKTNFTYDVNGNLKTITPAGKTAHTFNYNTYELTSAYLPPALTGVTKVSTEFAYNKDGQLTKITKPNNQAATFTYVLGANTANSGALSTIQTPQGTTYIQEQEGSGIVESATSPDGVTVSLGYAGSIVTSLASSGPLVANVTRTLDGNFRPVTERVDGVSSTAFSEVTFGYNDDDQLTSAGNETLTYGSTTGLLSGFTLGRVKTNLTYNSQFPELARTESLDGTTVLYRANLTRDALGRIRSKQETLGATTTTYFYEYNAAGQLFRVRTGSATGTIAAEYAYDANGNRLTVKRGTTTTTSTYDAQDRMLTAGGATFTHNANGEWTKKVQAGVTTNYVYGFFGNLRSATIGTKAITYLSDGFGHRVERKVNGTVSQRWIYDHAGRIVGETNASGVLTKRFVYGSRSHVPDYMITSTATYAFVLDHLGSVRLLVNTANGAKYQEMNFDEFGRVTKDTRPGAQPFGFAGGHYDVDTKLVRFGARDYDPETGRWTSKDPIGFAGGDSNLFGYVMNDPVNFIDPSGKWRNPSSIFDDALKHPNSSSGTDGIGNAFQHCYASCMMAAENGSGTAATMGAAFEIINDWNGQTPEQHNMDTQNNCVGRQLAAQNNLSNLTNFSESSHDRVRSGCSNACNRAGAAGQLTTLSGK